MNALYSLLSNAMPTKKAVLIGLLCSGIFFSPTLSAQVIEPASAAEAMLSDQSVFSLINEYRARQNPRFRTIVPYHQKPARFIDARRGS